MKKNKILFSLAALALISILSAFDIQDNNGQAGRTGSPGETTCNITCHTGSPLNDGTGTVTITSDIPNWEYMTNTTYNISVTVARAGNSLFGFDLECLDGSSPNQNAGTLQVTNTAETQIRNVTVNSVVRKNMVHKYNGGIGTDTKTFNFRWVSPATNVGNVTFYVTGNAADGNNMTSGDHIYSATQLVTPALGAAVGNHATISTGGRMYPNPASDHFTIAFASTAGENIAISLLSLEGKEIAKLYEGKGDGTEMEINLNLPEGIPAGLYFVKMQDGSISRLFVN